MAAGGREEHEAVATWPHHVLQGARHIILGREPTGAGGQRRRHGSSAPCRIQEDGLERVDAIPRLAPPINRCLRSVRRCHRRPLRRPPNVHARSPGDRDVVEAVGRPRDRRACPLHVRGWTALKGEHHLPRALDASETMRVRPQVKLMAGQGEPGSDNRGRSGDRIEGCRPGDILPAQGLRLALDTPPCPPPRTYVRTGRSVTGPQTRRWQDPTPAWGRARREPTQ